MQCQHGRNSRYDTEFICNQALHYTLLIASKSLCIKNLSKDHILFVMLSASREAWDHLLHKYHLFKPQYPFVWKTNGYVWIWKVMLHGGNSFQSHCTPATYPMFICWTMFYHRCVAKIRPHGTILQRRTISRTIIQKKIETCFHHINAYMGPNILSVR